LKSNKKPLSISFSGFSLCNSLKARLLLTDLLIFKLKCLHSEMPTEKMPDIRNVGIGKAVFMKYQQALSERLN
jgi:hypothetical protein